MHTENVRKTVRANPLARHKDRAEYFRSKRNVSMICRPFRRLQVGQCHTPRPCNSIRLDDGKVRILRTRDAESGSTLIVIYCGGTARCAPSWQPPRKRQGAVGAAIL